MQLDNRKIIPSIMSSANEEAAAAGATAFHQGHSIVDTKPNHTTDADAEKNRLSPSSSSLPSSAMMNSTETHRARKDSNHDDKQNSNSNTNDSTERASTSTFTSISRNNRADHKPSDSAVSDIRRKDNDNRNSPQEDHVMDE